MDFSLGIQRGSFAAALHGASRNFSKVVSPEAEGIRTENGTLH
jgi:hypothetical protein